MNIFWGSLFVAIVLVVVAGIVLAINCAFAILEFLNGDLLDDSEEYWQ